MKKAYDIGEHEPWRVSKDSAKNLVMAIIHTNANVIAASVDSTCPPTHANIRVEMHPALRSLFEEHLGRKIHPVETIKGA